MRTTHLVGLAISLSIFTGVATAACAEAQPTASVIDALSAIRAEPDENRRMKLGDAMVGALNSGAYAPMTDADIDVAALYLYDPDDWIRIWAIEALYFAGPRAARALPALRWAYEDIKCHGGAFSSEDLLPGELRRLGDVVPEPVCPPGTGLAG